MGVPHGDRGEHERDAVHLYRRIERQVFRAQAEGLDEADVQRCVVAGAHLRDVDGHVRGAEDGLAHVHACADDAVAAPVWGDVQDACAGLHVQGTAVGGHHAALQHELGEAADAVAAHLALGAVHVVHAHPYRSALRRRYDDEAVRADAEMAVGYAPGDVRPVVLLVQAVDVDVVVARTLEFRELHKTCLEGHSSMPGPLPSPRRRGRGTIEGSRLRGGAPCGSRTWTR